MAALLPRETYGRRATKEDFIDVSDDRAIEWNRGVRTPHNGTLTIVGDFDEKMVRQWVEESFGEWETRAPIIVAPPGMKAATGEPVETRLLKTPRPGSSQAELRFGCLLPRASTGAVVATHRIAASVLKDRLWRLLRDTLGATYDVDVASVALQGGTAWLELSTNVANEKLAASLRTTHQTLLALAREPISADELAWGRMDRAAHVARSQMTNESVAALYHSRTTLGLAVEPAAIRAELDAVTADGVREALQSCLAANPIMAIVGDEAMVQEAWKSW
ncbi:MAG: insulinase family protein [Deltaproteobacteria bacterium]|nr:insulinase family protein [Deltaproteobacteria bacterium]